MSESFDWEQKMSRDEALAILAKDDYARGHLEKESSDPEQGWEQRDLIGPVHDDDSKAVAGDDSAVRGLQL